MTFTSGNFCASIFNEPSTELLSNEHLPFYALHGAAHRIEALLQEVFDIIVDDDDRELHFN
jgi:hypothetical protein